jgi:benzoate/toluate 1,2-dioxygenase beta subunit
MTAQPARPPAASWETRTEVERLLYLEADLLDGRRYDEWLDLYTDDAVYWIPIREGATDPLSNVSIVRDDRAALQERVTRLGSGQAYGQIPPSRTRHLIGSLQVFAAEAGRSSASGSLAVFEVRRGRESILAGACTWELRELDGALKIASKRIDLVQSELPLGNLSAIL